MHFTVSKLFLSLKKAKGLENSRRNEWSQMSRVVERCVKLGSEKLDGMFGWDQEQ